MTDVSHPKARVLFLCTGNSCRSQMAEGLARDLGTELGLGDQLVFSAGSSPSQVNPLAVLVMGEIGIDMSNHRGKSFENLEDTSYDIIVSLSPEAQHQAVELSRTMACEVEFWNTLDPTIIEGNRETRLEAYRQVRDTLKKRIEARFALDLKPVV